MAPLSPLQSPSKDAPIATPLTPSTDPSAPYQQQLSDEPRDRYARLPSKLQSLLRAWMAIRWSLSQRVFFVPVPVLTAKFEVKKGDLVLTLPIVAILVVLNAALAGGRSVGGSGTPPTITLLLVFFFAIRNNVLLLELTGISFERSLFYHKLFAYVTIVLSALHGLAYLLAHHHGDERDKSSTAVSGTIAFAAMVLLFGMSLNVIRRRFFELFLRTHWLLFLVTIIAAVAHGAGVALIGFVPWVIDLAFRLGYRTPIYKQGAVFRKKGDNAALDSNRNVLNGNHRLGVIARDQVSVAALPGDITRVSFPRVRKDTGEEFSFEAGQFAFLCVPKLSLLEWHPFTISSSPHEDVVTFHIKAAGDWTAKLLAIAPKDEEVRDEAPFDILVDGPYGRVSIDVGSPTSYSHFALFSGGIGVTPMRSIVNWLHQERYTFGRIDIKRVHFVWSVPNRDTVQALMDTHLPNGEEGVTGYFPHCLLRDNAVTDATDPFYSEFYLTRAERDAESAVDQKLARYLRYGARPDTTAILRQLGELAKQDGKDRVAVLVCGPEAMVHDVINTSLTLSKEMTMHFDVHSELFEF